MWRHWNLSTKFTALLAAVFLVGATIGGFVLWRVLQVGAEAEVALKGSVLLQTMNSVRSYTSEHIDPILQNSAAMQDKFIPETVPAFSARTVFEHLRQDKRYEGFFCREATLNPTNPLDQADSFETALVNQMRQESRSEYAAFRTRDGEQVYYVAHPMRVASETCLTCHGDPSVAPPSMVAQYGTTKGFGWKLNEVVAAQIVYVPADEVLKNAEQTFSVAASLMFATLLLVVVLTNVLLRRDIIRPVGVLGLVAGKLSADVPISDDLQSQELSRIADRADELGQAARVFRRMASEVYARTQSLKQQVQELRIEIDEAKRRQSVAEIAGSDFFQNLKSQARQFRDRREGGNPASPDDSTPET
jgi:methyl-accepting chemotaxis protein